MKPPSIRPFARAFAPGLTGGLAALLLVGCAGAPGPAAPRPVSADEVPELVRLVAQNPGDGALRLRYAAALAAAGRCPDALEAAERGRELAPADPLGPLVQGSCLEDEGRRLDALEVYRAYLSEHGATRGAAAVRARERLARREHATELARIAVAREAELAEAEADADAVAVLPVHVFGAERFQPLSLGLAAMMISDLAILDRFPLVERLQLDALLRELELQQGERVDPATAARVGRLVGAGTVVQGALSVPSEERASLEATLAAADGFFGDPEEAAGRFQELMRMEKQLVIGVATRLGYTPSPAEEARILENGTSNLLAFLSYSRGLAAEAAGDYAAAAAHFADALRADPDFQQAREEMEVAAAIPLADGAPPGELTRLADLASREVDRLTGAGEDLPPAPSQAPIGNALDASTLDVASLTSERVTGSGDEEGATGNGNLTHLTSSPTAQPAPTGGTTVPGSIRIIFRLP